ncbi:CBS domain-containing protein [Bdellovibrionota bacterium FG-2]
MAGIRPSPAIIVEEDVALGECVRQMREKNAGSVLVVKKEASGSSPGSTADALVGIFTERDFMQKVSLLPGKEWQHRMIGSVMTPNPISISLAQVKDAAAIMIRSGIRHLPVVIDLPGNPSALVGVVSMRDLFKHYYELSAGFPLGASASVPVANEVPRESQVGLLTDDEKTRALLMAGLSSLSGSTLIRMSYDEVLSDSGLNPTLKGLGVFVIDLDQLGSAKWSLLLRNLNLDPDAPPAVIVFNPMLCSPQELAVLERLEASRKFSIFRKPLNPLELFEHLQALLVR